MFESLNLAIPTTDARPQSAAPAKTAFSSPMPAGAIREAAERNASGFVASLLESGLALLDASGRVSEINPALLRWLKKTQADVLGRSFWILLAERCVAWGQALEALRSGTDTFAQIHLKLPGDAGRPPQWFRLELARCSAASFVHFSSLGLIADKQTASWKQTLSVLTTGLAHGFGNVIGRIHSLSESFLEQPGPGHGFSEDAREIKASAERAIQIVRRIISLHQDRSGKWDYHNLNDLAAEIAELASQLPSSRIELALELAAESLPVYLDAVEFRQVLANLAVSLVEAMPSNARLVLRTSTHTHLPPLQQCHGQLPRAPAVCFGLESTGCEIPARHLAGIFDPFTVSRTTKGSGLSLYEARLFAEKHRGAISLDASECSTSVRLWFPQADFTEAENPLLRAGPLAAESRPLEKAP